MKLIRILIENINYYFIYNFILDLLAMQKQCHQLEDQ